MTAGVAKIGSRIGRGLMHCKPIAKVTMKISKRKPEIMAVGGGVLVLAAFGWAIYEAINVKEVMEEGTAKVQQIEAEYEVLSDEEKAATAKAHFKKMKLAKAEGIWKVSRKFIGPSVTLVVGMGLGAKAVTTLRAENVLIGGALKSLKDIHDRYRENVRQDLGEEADLKYARGVVGEEEIEEKTKDIDGNEVTKKVKVPVVKEQDGNPWRFEYCEDLFTSWQDDPERNINILKITQDWWNHELERYEDVSMYDILKHLGYRFDVRRDGMTKKQYREFIAFLRMYGWRKGSNGDGFIDLGIYRAINEPAIKRQSSTIWIEFNCDGPLTEI